MPKKPAKDPRTWLPPRTSQYGREVDVALQLVSRAAASDPSVAGLVAQAVIADGLASEWPGDTLLASESAASLAALDDATKQLVLEQANAVGATTPCVNSYDPPYPVPVAATQLDETTLAAALDRRLGPDARLTERTWALAPVDMSLDQPAIALTLLEYGQPVVAAVAMPKLPRQSMKYKKLLRMPASMDGQIGAVPVNGGTLMWAEEGQGAYERSIGDEHGMDVRIRVDASLIGKRSLVGTGVPGARPVPVPEADFAEVTRCEAETQPRAAKLAEELGITQTVSPGRTHFAYGLVARGEAQVYTDLPDSAMDMDAGSHAAGALLVHEAGGKVTDAEGNLFDFSLPGKATVTGTVASNGALHERLLEGLRKIT